MDKAAVHDIVIALIAEQISKQASDINEGSTFEALNLDSLDRVEVVMKIEETLHIEMNDERVDGIKTVGELIAYCSELKNK